MPYIDRSVLPFDKRLPPRFWAKVEFTTDGCWIWTGALTGDGYGVVQWERRAVLVHRFIYERTVGRIERPALDHLCRERSCVNPAHLEPVTDGENLRRSPITQMSKNLAKTHCVRGHPLSGGNLYKPSLNRRVCWACKRFLGARFMREVYVPRKRAERASPLVD